jgi:hypothetical protein
MNQKPCKVCKNKFTYTNSTQVVCGYICALKYAKKEVKVVARLKVQKKKEAKEKLKSNSEWLNELQTIINKIVREIDKDLLCLATNKKTSIIHAGHVMSRASTPFLRFNLHNIHRQSGQSNHFQSDDLKLREGLINEYGAKYFDYLIENRSGILKFSVDEIKIFKEKGRKFLKWVSIQDRSTPEKRVKLRNLANFEIFENTYKTYII